MKRKRAQGMPTKRRLAFHEAGHAAMALILGNRISRITIRPKGKMLGHVVTFPRSPSGDVLTAVAGHTAEAIRFRERYYMGGPDLRYAKSLVSMDGVAAFCSLAARMLRVHWAGVVALARSLEERGRLTRTEAWEAFCEGLAGATTKSRKRRARR